MLVWRSCEGRAGLQSIALLGLLDAETGTPLQDLREPAVIMGVEMLDEDDGLGEVSRDRREHSGQGLHAPGRGDDGHDGESIPGGSAAFSLLG
jgi:hypothetical protein